MLEIFANKIALLGVLITTGFNLLVIWWLDRFEKEPLWLLALVFLWGAVPAITISIFFERYFNLPVSEVFGHGFTSGIVGTALVAPIVEEIAKAVALLVVFVVLSREFDDVMDGFVFGAVIGLGFAFNEDLMYLKSAVERGGFEEMTYVFNLRIFVFGLSHAFYTGITGIGLGLAKLQRWYFGIPLVIMGLLTAIMIHATHNLLVSVPGYMIPGGTILAWIVHTIIALALFVLVIAIWIAELLWVREELREEKAAGLISDFEYDRVISFFGKFKTEIRFLLYMDIVGYIYIRKLFNLLVKLAFRKRIYSRKMTPGREKHLDSMRAKITKIRTKLNTRIEMQKN